MNKFTRYFQPPTVATLKQEELAELRRMHYLEDRRADHHRAQADAIQKRINKLEQPTNGS